MENRLSDWDNAIANLCPSERKEALEHLEQLANDTEAGIIRQILGEEKKPLSEAQQYVYKKNIEPSLVERCGSNGCKEFVLAGANSCKVCEIEYG